jgi:hypothetical protein
MTGADAPIVELPAVQGLLASWWFDYDAGAFPGWPRYFTAEASFTCRSDSGQTAFEEFVTADVRGRDRVVAWQEAHRRESPYPLRHNATNVHLTATGPDSAVYRSYLFVTQIVSGAVSNVASGTCCGTVVVDGDDLRFASLDVVLDFTDSEPYATATKFG